MAFDKFRLSGWWVLAKARHWIDGRRFWVEADLLDFGCPCILCEVTTKLWSHALAYAYFEGVITGRSVAD